MERVFLHLPGTVRRGRNGQLFVTMREITFLVLKLFEFSLHRLAHRGESAINADDSIGAYRGSRGRYRIDDVCDWRVKVNVSAAMIEVHPHVWISQCGF